MKYVPVKNVSQNGEHKKKSLSTCSLHQTTNPETTNPKVTYIICEINSRFVDSGLDAWSDEQVIWYAFKGLVISFLVSKIFKKKTTQKFKEFLP